MLEYLASFASVPVAVAIVVQKASGKCAVCSIRLVDVTAATGQRHQCAHHTPATGGEERES